MTKKQWDALLEDNDIYDLHDEFTYSEYYDNGYFRFKDNADLHEMYQESDDYARDFEAFLELKYVNGGID